MIIKYLRIVIVPLFSILSVCSIGQTADSLTTAGMVNSSGSFPLKQQILPLGLISGGVILESVSFKNDIQSKFPKTHTTIDDYLRDVPVVMLYGADALGFSHKNNVFNQTKYLIISRLTTGFLTGILKRITHVQRPNEGSYDAFPSGHTSEAFTSATFLYRETIGYEPWLAYSGYAVATATGVLRITNGKHWVGDVLAGAGLGILVTNMVYYIEPLKNWDPFKINKKTAIIPDINIDTHTYCLGISISLD